MDEIVLLLVVKQIKLEVFHENIIFYCDKEKQNNFFQAHNLKCDPEKTKLNLDNLMTQVVSFKTLNIFF